MSDVSRVHSHIRRMLGGYGSLNSWLAANVPEYTSYEMHSKEVADYRVRWCLHMAQELEAQGE